MSKAYDFTSPGVGSYDLMPHSSFHFVDENDGVGVIHAETPKAHTAEVNGPLIRKTVFI